MNTGSLLIGFRTTVVETLKLFGSHSKTAYERAGWRLLVTLLDGINE
jgi:hypothetical protein